MAVYLQDGRFRLKLIRFKLCFLLVPMNQVQWIPLCIKHFFWSQWTKCNEYPFAPNTSSGSSEPSAVNTLVHEILLLVPVNQVQWIPLCTKHFWSQWTKCSEYSRAPNTSGPSEPSAVNTLVQQTLLVPVNQVQWAPFLSKTSYGVNKSFPCYHMWISVDGNFTCLKIKWNTLLK